jgi:hypothetical protein
MSFLGRWSLSTTNAIISEIIEGFSNTDYEFVDASVEFCIPLGARS